MVVAAVAAVLALSGCEPRQVGSAATVGESRLSVDEVQQRVEDYAQTLPGSPSVARVQLGPFQSRIVQLWVQHELFTRIAADRGITVAQSAVDAQLKTLQGQGRQAYLGQLAQQGFTEQTVRTFVEDQLIAAKLGPSAAARQALQAESARARVWVNPRYGTWDGSQVTPGTGSISVPVSPTGQPTPSPAG